MGMMYVLGVLSLVALAQGADQWVDVFSGEHFDDIVSTSDGKFKFNINVVLMIYKKSCTPTVNLKITPLTQNLLYLQYNPEKASEHLWFDLRKNDDLRKRYIPLNNTDCQVAMFFKKDQSLKGKPTTFWNKTADPEIEEWMWKLVSFKLTFINNYGETVGITQKPYEGTPRLKYEFLYEDEELDLTTNPGYEIVIHTTDKSKVIGTKIAEKEAKLVVEDGMESDDIWAVKHKEWERSDKIIQWTRHNSIRYLGLMKQPLFVHNYTKTGWKLKDIPGSAHKLIKDYYKKNRDSRTVEDVRPEELIIINKFEVKPSFIELSETLIDAVSGYITPIMESWCNCKLDYSATYGVLELHQGNLIKNHVSWVNNFVITAIMIIEDLPANSTIQMEVIGYDGVRKEIDMKAGQMLLIETAKVIHGMPKTFKGKNLAMLEMSFIPQHGWTYRIKGAYLVNDKTGEEEPMLVKETEFTRKKKMFLMKDEL